MTSKTAPHDYQESLGLPRPPVRTCAVRGLSNMSCPRARQAPCTTYSLLPCRPSASTSPRTPPSFTMPRRFVSTCVTRRARHPVSTAAETRVLIALAAVQTRMHRRRTLQCAHTSVHGARHPLHHRSSAASLQAASLVAHAGTLLLSVRSASMKVGCLRPKDADRTVALSPLLSSWKTLLTNATTFAHAAKHMDTHTSFN